MGKYRKRPIVVEAVQYQAGVKIDGVETQEDNRGPYGMFMTIHGQATTVFVGDWLIRESDGIHWYPCKPDIFSRTYEKVDD